VELLFFHRMGVVWYCAALERKTTCEEELKKQSRSLGAFARRDFGNIVLTNDLLMT
jgi:hypothetical protein